MKQADFETGFTLLIVPLVLLLWVYYGKRSTFERLCPRLSDHRRREFNGVLYEYITAFSLMFGVPFVVMVAVFKRDPRDLGLELGYVRIGGRILIFGLPLAVFAAWVGTASSAMRAEYPLAKSVKGHPGWFLVTEAFYLVYYLGWEFLFRGVMLFELDRRYGALLAVLVQTIPSAVAHIGKPAAESFAAIVAGVLFGSIALETHSIVYPLVLHATLGISTDVFSLVRSSRAS